MINPPVNLVKQQEPYVECPICHSKSWTIYTHRVECCRCGLSYTMPNITFIPTTVIQETIPSPEIVKALEILDSPEK